MSAERNMVDDEREVRETISVLWGLRKVVGALIYVTPVGILSDKDICR